MATTVRRVQLSASSSSDDESDAKQHARAAAGQPARLKTDSNSSSLNTSSSSIPHLQQKQQRMAPSMSSSTATSASTSPAAMPHRTVGVVTRRASIASSSSSSAVPPAMTTTPSLVSRTEDKPLPLPVRKSSKLAAPEQATAASSAQQPSLTPLPVQREAATTNVIAAAIQPPPPPVLRALPSSSSTSSTDSEHDRRPRRLPVRPELSTAAKTTERAAVTPAPAASPPAPAATVSSASSAPVEFALGFRRPPTETPRGPAPRAAEAAAPVPPPSFSYPAAATPVRERRAEAVKKSLPSLFSDETPSPTAKTENNNNNNNNNNNSIHTNNSNAAGLSRLVDFTVHAPPPTTTSAESQPAGTARPAGNGVRRVLNVSSSSSSTVSPTHSQSAADTHGAPARAVSPSASDDDVGVAAVVKRSIIHFGERANDAHADAEDEDDDDEDVAIANTAAERWDVGAGGVNSGAEHAQPTHDAVAESAVTTTTTTTTIPHTTLPASPAHLDPARFNRVSIGPHCAMSEAPARWGHDGGRGVGTTSQISTRRIGMPTHTADHALTITSATSAVMSPTRTATDGALIDTETHRVVLDDSRLKRKRKSMATRLSSIDPARSELTQGSAAAQAASLPLPTNAEGAASTRADGLEEGRSTASTPSPQPVATPEGGRNPDDESETTTTSTADAAAAKARRLAEVKTTTMKVRRLLEPRLGITDDLQSAYGANTTPAESSPSSRVGHGRAGLSDWLLRLRGVPDATHLPTQQKGVLSKDDVCFNRTPFGYAARTTPQSKVGAAAFRMMKRHTVYPVTLNSRHGPHRTPAAANSGPKTAWSSEWMSAVLDKQMGVPAHVALPARTAERGVTTDSDAVRSRVGSRRVTGAVLDPLPPSPPSRAAPYADTVDLLFANPSAPVMPAATTHRRTAAPTATASAARRTPQTVSSFATPSRDLFRAAPARRTSTAGTNRSHNAPSAAWQAPASASSWTESASGPAEGSHSRAAACGVTMRRREHDVVSSQSGEETAPSRSAPPPPATTITSSP